MAAAHLRCPEDLADRRTGIVRGTTTEKAPAELLAKESTEVRRAVNRARADLHRSQAMYFLNARPE
jgi:hypothetical protein